MVYKQQKEKPKGGNATMMTFQLNLSRPQEEELILQLQNARQRGDFQEYNRISALLSLADGHSMDEIGNILRSGVSTIYKWFKNYILDGIQALSSKKSPGRPSKLTKKQKKQLCEWVTKAPEACGFASSCWRTPMLQELILAKWGVFYSVHYLSQLLKNLGFSYQKAAFVAAAQDMEKRENWIKNQWPAILRQAKRKAAYLLFGDEASFPQWGTLSYTWARIGKQPVVKTSGNRQSYKVLGLIDYFTGKLFAKGHHGKLNADTYIEFLTEVLSKTRKHIILIQDGAPYHRGGKMKTFFEQHKNRLTMYQLPAYSPDFNPIEGLWKKIKTQGTHLKYFPTFDSLVNKVEEMIVQFSDSAQEVLALFGFYTKAQTA